jgi:hypothetical protein
MVHICKKLIKAMAVAGPSHFCRPQFLHLCREPAALFSTAHSYVVYIRCGVLLICTWGQVRNLHKERWDAHMGSIEARASQEFKPTANGIQNIEGWR